MKVTLSNLVLYLAAGSIPFDFAFKLGVVRVTPTEVLFSLALLLWLAQIVRTPKSIELAPYFFPLLFFLAACMLSMLAAQNRFAALRETVQFAWLFGLFYFVAHKVRERRDVFTLWSLLLIAGLVAALIGIYQYFFVREPIHFLISATRLRAHGAFDQPNTFGCYLIGVIPFLFGFYFLAEARAAQMNERYSLIDKIFFNQKIIRAFLFILSAALIATFSRGSWISLVGGLAILYFLLWKKIRHLSFALLLGITALAAGLVIVDKSLSPKQQLAGGRSFSNRQRSELLKTAIKVAREHPLSGIGFGNFPDRLLEYASPELMQSMQFDYDKISKEWFINPNKKPDIEIVHNTLLQVVAETGLIGLVAFVWLFWIYGRDALKHLRESVDRQEYCIRATALASVAAVLCSGMFGWPFSHGVQEVLIISMAIAISPLTRTESSWQTTASLPS